LRSQAPGLAGAFLGAKPSGAFTAFNPKQLVAPFAFVFFRIQKHVLTAVAPLAAWLAMKLGSAKIAGDVTAFHCPSCVAAFCAAIPRKFAARAIGLETFAT
jgi:hypothetical protein